MKLTIINLAIGGLLLALGLWSFTDPGVFSTLYGLDANTPQARIFLRTLIGGGVSGLGAAIAFGGLIGVAPLARARIALCVFVGVIFTRILSIALEGMITPALWLELSAELLVAVFIAEAVARKQ